MSQILGVPETLAAFARLQVEAEAGEKVSELAGAQIVAANVRTKAPVLTGQLRGSIVVRSEENGIGVVALSPHAGFVEFGTRYMAAQPFMREAADESEISVGSVMTTLFKQILR